MTHIEANGDSLLGFSSARTVHRELVYRPLQFHKRSQLFIGTHDEAFRIVACASATSRSASLAHTDRARIVFDCRMADVPAMMASNVETNYSLGTAAKDG